MNNSAVPAVTGDSYLAGEDDDFINRPGGFILQELADDETAKDASSDDSKIFVPGHVYRLDAIQVALGGRMLSPLSSDLSLSFWAQRHLIRPTHSVTPRHPLTLA